MFFSCILLALQGCQTDLYKNLSEKQANAIVATLAHSGISADRQFQDDGGVTVLVDKSNFANAVGVLDKAGLPKKEFANIGQVFKGNGLVSSPAQERARMVYALSQELSHTVSDIDGVLDARVQVVLPNNDVLDKNKKPSSASVFVRHNSVFDVKQMTPRVKQLVANGVSGLTYDNVSVVTVAAPTAIAAVNIPGGAQSSFVGIAMPASSVTTVRWLFGVLLLIIVLLASALGWVFWRQRSTQTYALKSSPS